MTPAAPRAIEVNIPSVAEPPEPSVPIGSQKPPAHGRPSAPPQWSLTLHDGSVIHVSGTLLLGRDPAQVEPWTSGALLRINDPEKSVSKTHAALDCRSDELWVVDLHSTNGVAVVDPDGQETVLELGERASVSVGSTIELGRYRIRVDRQ